MDKERTYLSLRWDPDEKRYKAYEHGTDRRLYHVIIGGMTAELHEVLHPREMIMGEAIVLGFGKAPDEDDRICIGLKALPSDHSGILAGHDALEAIDLAADRPIGRLTHIEARAYVNEVFEITFGFIAMDNEPSPEHLKEHENRLAEAYA